MRAFGPEPLEVCGRHVSVLKLCYFSVCEEGTLVLSSLR